MRVLIDTNIFIELEGSTVIRDSCLELLKSLESNSHQILIHPSSRDDLERDANVERRAANLSKVKKYAQLERPPECHQEFETRFGILSKKDNDRVDHNLLCAVFQNTVHILVTEDQRIHKKAKLLGVSDRVFYVEQAANSVAVAIKNTKVELPNIQQVYVYEIHHHLQEPFFDSLRLAYADFDRWFLETCSRGGREAWVYWKSPGTIGALCIIKECIDEIVSDSNESLPGKSLKLCTFKVDSSVQGRKVGELFLKAAFRYATQNFLENIFIEMRPNQLHLASMCEDFGFSKLGTKGSDNVFRKEHPKSPPIIELPPLQYHRRFAPHFSGKSTVQKYIIPIKPEYHKQLFPDWEDDTGHLKLPLANRSLPGNAMKLAYISKSNVTSIQQGDVLVFYRSGDCKALTTIGIVETAERLSDLDKILQLVLKRTVYSGTELEKLANNECLVLLTRLALHLPKIVSRDLLADLGEKGNFQSVRKISDELFARILEKSGVKNCLLTD